MTPVPRCWWERRDLRLCPPELIGNARDDFVDLTPVSAAPAATLAAGYAALLPGQAVPLPGEVLDDDPCLDR